MRKKVRPGSASVADRGRIENGVGRASPFFISAGAQNYHQAFTLYIMRFAKRPSQLSQSFHTGCGRGRPALATSSGRRSSCGANCLSFRMINSRRAAGLGFREGADVIDRASGSPRSRNRW